jgi:DNA-directed RNA polymerase specialized sigma24 family protein
MGSVIEGEDVVQDTLARAFVALQDLEEAPPLGPAVPRARPATQRQGAHAEEPSDADADVVDSAQPDPLVLLMRKDAVKPAVSRFAELPTLQRSVVILRRQLPCGAAG